MLDEGVAVALANLNYDAQTANFTLDEVVTGATSGATAIIISDTDNGAIGTLALGGAVV